jgi:hypothetical protein
MLKLDPFDLPTHDTGDVETPGFWYCPDLPKALFLTGETDANARAKMLIYLIENKLVGA